MMNNKIAGVIKNDFSAAPGICVSVFVQGCPFKCKGCHNPETWDFDGGRELTELELINICNAMRANSIHRDLAVMGGEPMVEDNLNTTKSIIQAVKAVYPDTKVYIWTGYTYEQLINREDKKTNEILEMADVLIDGPYIEEQRDITLFMRGSRNQRIIDLHLLE